MTEPALDDSPDGTTANCLLPGALAVLLAVAIIVAAWLWWDNRPPGTDSADAGFARDMTDHHSQAVEMALIAFERTEDPAIRLIGYDIATSQQAQIGMMTAWLNMWDLPTARPGEPMAWAGDELMGDHEMESGDVRSVDDMPGMMVREQIDELRTLEPAEMDIQFLTLMTEHHEGGILMAKAALAEAGEEVVLDLANAIIISQTAEITNMQAMLDEREGA